MLSDSVGLIAQIATVTCVVTPLHPLGRLSASDHDESIQNRGVLIGLG